MSEQQAALRAAVQRAVQAGVLPGDAARSAAFEGPERRWPVVLLTGLGAWLAAVPLLAALALALGDSLKGGVPFAVGGVALVVAVALLRRPLPLFVEQLAVPILLAGGGLFCVGFFNSFDWQGAVGASAVVALIAAVLLPQAWLRVLLGALTAQALVLALVPERSFGRFGADDRSIYWLALHGLLAVWLIGGGLQRIARPALAATLEAIGCGWLLAVLFDLAWLAGSTFLVSGIFGTSFQRGSMPEALWQDHGPMEIYGPPLASLGLALAASVRAAWAWPAMRRKALMLAAIVPIALAWLLPTLGAVLLALALMVTTRRWKRAAFAALAAAWIVGSFYYLLAWPLAQKALWLAGAAAVLGLSAYLMWSRPSPAPARRRAPAATLPIGLALAATLLAVNIGIAQKERLIAHGQPLFVALQPVDPRSLMQGDFMRLNFMMPTDAAPPEQSLGADRPRIVMKRDARGVGTYVRPAIPPVSLQPGELLLELTAKNGDWVIVTDGWFFEEGEAERFAAARFGEFRVDANGRALLVGLADERLRPIR